MAYRHPTRNHALEVISRILYGIALDSFLDHHIQLICTVLSKFNLSSYSQTRRWDQGSLEGNCVEELYFNVLIN